MTAEGNDRNARLAGAVRRQSLIDVQAALEAGANPNAYVDGKSMLGHHEENMFCAEDMYAPAWLAILQSLLEGGADPNMATNLEQGPDYLLHGLALNAVVPALRLMLDHGADPNILLEGETPLDYQCGDECYVVTCYLPAEYRELELPEYPVPTGDDRADQYGLTRTKWLASQHQRANALLRERGAKLRRELREAVDGSVD